MTNTGDADQARWSVGAVAKASGLTVRTLHHYDELGLLTPSARTHSGHRRYTEGDLNRLFVSLGASLDRTENADTVIDGYWYGLAKRSVQFT
ncbi:MerR family transcriptional regulator [Kibdelosporangium lantanae]|uniref:MerR family transcriptional regulator n=1 Tax=Kibdelosporangium lantanae TaxID=1497396 RepID=A0ABW3MBU8_9PSEU